MAGVAKKSHKGSEYRESVLAELGEAAATLPFDPVAVRAARKKVVTEGGDELVVESMGIVAMFETITKIVDATGKKPHSSIMYTVMPYILTIAETIFWLLAKIGLARQ